MDHKRSAQSRVPVTLRRRLSAALFKLTHVVRLKTHTESEPEHLKHPVLPTGPFEVHDRASIGVILLFVPRNLEGRIIDEATGRYGYSHLAVDCGEIDLPTGKRVMVETTEKNVHRGFQDEYGARAFVRLPLALQEADGAAFCACVVSKIGETYDYEEALTRGLIDDPAKQVCSDLATVCLPETLREDIARQAETRGLRRFSVSVHHHAHGKIELFVSPNGFAQYLGAPRGQDLPPDAAQPGRGLLLQVAHPAQPNPVPQASPAEQPSTPPLKPR